MQNLEAASYFEFCQYDWQLRLAGTVVKIPTAWLYPYRRERLVKAMAKRQQKNKILSFPDRDVVLTPLQALEGSFDFRHDSSTKPGDEYYMMDYLTVFSSDMFPEMADFINKYLHGQIKYFFDYIIDLLFDDQLEDLFDPPTLEYDTKFVLIRLRKIIASDVKLSKFSRNKLKKLRRKFEL